MKSKSNNDLVITFSNIIDDYEDARPRYPMDVFNKINEFASLRKAQNILEVGAGTGQATELFVPETYNLDLLEVSANQVDYLDQKYKSNKKITVIESYFEEYKTDTMYDLIYSATAFHWIKSEVGYPKAWNMLKDGGSLAVFWQMFSVTYHGEGIFKLLNQIQRKYMQDCSLGFDEAGLESAKQKRIEQIQTGGYFQAPIFYEYKWIDTYDANRYVKLINSYSSTQQLEDEMREKYLHEISETIIEYGDVIEVPQHVCLYMVKK